MDMTKNKDQINIEVRDFQLDHIFDCGQCFRWTKEQDGTYTGVVSGKVINVELSHREDERGVLTIHNCTWGDFKNIWEDYLDLKKDYGEIKKQLSFKDSIMAEAIRYGEGIRILKQDKWETLASFIISQNNNIPRIKGCIESLCCNFGDRITDYRGRTHFSFPTFERLAALKEEDLACCKLGYRAEYIIKTARAVASDGGRGLEATEQQSYEEAFSYLVGLSGVGPKVANCILLFSMGKYDAFPIDVWVKRVMNRLYYIDEKDQKSIKTFAETHFSPWSGMAQQYLFYFITKKAITLK